MRAGAVPPPRVPHRHRAQRAAHHVPGGRLPSTVFHYHRENLHARSVRSIYRSGLSVFQLMLSLIYLIH